MASTPRRIAVLASLLALAACGPDTAAEDAVPAPAPATDAVAPSSGVARLLADEQVVFGYFPRDPSPEQAASLVTNREIDFVMLSQEDELDVAPLQAYVQAMRDAAAEAGVEPIPVFIRMPSADTPEATTQRAQQAADAGVGGIVFPHVATARQAEISVDAMGDRLWREGAAGGELVNVQIVEEQEGIANVADIVDTPGLSVVFAGPGTLRQSYEGDMVAVENAIQSVLAACKASDVPCGITAGPDDIEQRLGEGFEVIIVYDLAALPIGRAAAGR